MDKVEKFLAHYSSPYYDPQKAHDYYEQHKQLANKNAASALTSKAQRDTFAVSVSNINAAKKSELTASQAAEVARLKALSDHAKAVTDQITANLNALAQSLKNGLAVLKVNEIPANATPQQRAFLQKQNAILRAKAAAASQNTLHNASGQAARDRAKVVSDLTTAINKARSDYNAGVVALQTKYQNITATEKQNIHNQVAGAPPKVAKVIKKAAGRRTSTKSRRKKK
jgi:hypothetical protein